MKKPKLYLETSVWNFYFADDAPNLRDITELFFQQVKKEIFEIYISEVVIDEFAKAKPKIVRRLTNLIQNYKPKILPLEKVADELAFEYIEYGVLSMSSLQDCRHAAIATVYELDYLLSWNLKHLANANKMQGINSVNLRNGYHKKLDLVTPSVMAEYE